MIEIQELYQLNKLYIVESLDDLLKTGSLLYEALLSEKTKGHFPNFSIEYIEVANIPEWDKFIDHVLSDVDSGRIKPIIHLEMHGDPLTGGVFLNQTKY